MRISDWSSDVCSSDLEGLALDAREHQQRREGEQDYRLPKDGRFDHLLAGAHRLLETFAKIEQTPFMLLPVRQSGEAVRSEEHTSELQSLMRISYAVFCLKKKINP